MHVNLLCACWHSEAVKGLSSLSNRRLLISLWVTSPLFLCPEPTDAPYPYYEDLAPPSPKWRPHPQGPRHLEHIRTGLQKELSGEKKSQGVKTSSFNPRGAWLSDVFCTSSFFVNQFKSTLQCIHHWWISLMNTPRSHNSKVWIHRGVSTPQWWIYWKVDYEYK